MGSPHSVSHWLLLLALKYQSFWVDVVAVYMVYIVTSVSKLLEVSSYEQTKINGASTEATLESLTQLSRKLRRYQIIHTYSDFKSQKFFWGWWMLMLCAFTSWCSSGGFFATWCTFVGGGIFVLARCTFFRIGGCCRGWGWSPSSATAFVGAWWLRCGLFLATSAQGRGFLCIFRCNLAIHFHGNCCSSTDTTSIHLLMQ